MRRNFTKQVIASTRPQECETNILGADASDLELKITKKEEKSPIVKTRIGVVCSASISEPTLEKIDDIALEQARNQAREWKLL